MVCDTMLVVSRFQAANAARLAPKEPVSRGLSQIVIPLCHSPYRTSDSVLAAPNSDGAEEE